jgi:hypothetical protein
MKFLAVIISVAALCLPFTTSAPLETRALQPAFDPFYIPPSGWESQPVGTILNTRIIVPATGSSCIGLKVQMESRWLQ